MSWDYPPAVLENEVVRLSPLVLEDWGDLQVFVNPESTRFWVSTMLLDESEDEWLEFQRSLLSTRAWPMVVRTLSDGAAVGLTCFMDLRPEARGVEIGMTIVHPEYRRTAVNASMKLLMLTHCFEVMGAIRVQLKCDARNEVSKMAIQKLGAKPEGVLRQHGVQRSGNLRDTAMFSILDSEWPEAKRGIQERLQTK